MKIESLCIFCQHFDFEQIGYGADYSTMTGGDPYGGFSCKKRHYTEIRPYDGYDVRKLLLTAESCPDYSVAADITGN